MYDPVFVFNTRGYLATIFHCLQYGKTVGEAEDIAGKLRNQILTVQTE